MSAGDRSASATIRGYNYQFDSAILSILSLTENQSLIIEGLEDFDIDRNGTPEFVQCKYYAATKLTDSVIRDVVEPMLVNLKRRGTTRPCRFKLYGHFRESSTASEGISPKEMKNCLRRKEYVKDDHGNRLVVEHDLMVKHGLTDELISWFCDHFSIEIGPDCDSLRESVITELAGFHSVTREQAEYYSYPAAFTFVARRAALQDVEQRTVTIDQFSAKVSSLSAQYTRWFRDQIGATKFHLEMRRRYFSQINIETVDRIFVFQTMSDTPLRDLLLVVDALRNKWSSHRISRKPVAERFAPAVYFRGLSDGRLLEMKNALSRQHIVFTDGYPFLGSAFSTEDFFSPQTAENKLCLRILGTDDHAKIVTGSSRKTLIYFDFYLDGASTLCPADRLKVEIPISQLVDVLNII